MKNYPEVVVQQAVMFSDEAKLAMYVFSKGTPKNARDLLKGKVYKYDKINK